MLAIDPHYPRYTELHVRPEPPNKGPDFRWEPWRTKHEKKHPIHKQHRIQIIRFKVDVGRRGVFEARFATQFSARENRLWWLRRPRD